MSTGVASWSQTASSNSTADANVNFAEGQAPASLNDSCRAAMASVAKWRDDIFGTIAAGGTSTAYTVTSNQGLAANTNGFTIQFVAGTTNGGATTLSVDSNTAKPLRFLTGIDLPAGVVVSGSIYRATYYSSTTEWLLHSFDASIYAIPLGGLIDYTGGSAPNGAFVIPTGQAISRTTYAGYFSLVGTGFGTGDGSTTFNVPDLRGRVVAGLDSSASRLNLTGGMNGTGIGSVGGTQTNTLATANLPAYTPSGSIVTSVSFGNSTIASNILWASGAGVYSPPGGSAQSIGSLGSLSATSTFTGAAQGGSSTAFTNLQPTIALNKILRIL